jgi:uncharacterized protein GlcG (DUF336 family)
MICYLLLWSRNHRHRLVGVRALVAAAVHGGNHVVVGHTTLHGGIGVSGGRCHRGRVQLRVATA